ncbi:MAG TPA: response regulator [Clostridia bacterium]|nr:response regulator [Clostridia bacterium]
MRKNPVLKEATILVVDDQASVRHLIAEFLRTDTRRVIAAESGHRALSLVETEEIDVVLLDVQMPGMDGLATLKALRARGFTGRVVLLTAHHEKEFLDHCAELGVHHTLVKPFDIFELKEVLHASLAEEPRKFCAC